MKDKCGKVKEKGGKVRTTTRAARTNKAWLSWDTGKGRSLIEVTMQSFGLTLLIYPLRKVPHHCPLSSSVWPTSTFILGLGFSRNTLRVEQFLIAEQAATLQIAAEHANIKPMECGVLPCLHINMPDANSTKVGVALFVSCIFCVTARTIMKSIYVLLCAIGLELRMTGSLHIQMPDANLREVTLCVSCLFSATRERLHPSLLASRRTKMYLVSSSRCWEERRREEVMRAQLAINPSLPKSLQEVTPSNGSSESVDQASDLLSFECARAHAADVRCKEYDVRCGPNSRSLPHRRVPLPWPNEHKRS